MMKTKTVLVATMAILASGTMASAQIEHAWFTLESTNGNATATEGPGLALEILNAVPDEILTIGYNFTDAFAPMTTWAINLTTTNGVFQNGDWSLSNAAGYDTDFGNPIQQNTNFDVGGISHAGVGAPGLVFTFEFVVDGAADVTGDFGSIWQIYQGFRWYGFVGPNPISYGEPDYTGGPDITPGWGSLPVVTVSMVPEPSSIALLAFGSFMIFRRKR